MSYKPNWMNAETNATEAVEAPPAQPAFIPPTPAPGVAFTTAAKPVKNKFEDFFAAMAEAKPARAAFPPSLVPGHIIRDPNQTAEGDVNVISSQEAWYVCEILKQGILITKGGNSFKTEVIVRESTGDTPKGVEAVINLWTSNFKYADMSADLISAIHNVHIKLPDPQPNPNHYPLVVRLANEAVEPETQPNVGKFFSVHCSPYSKPVDKQTGAFKKHKRTGLVHQFFNMRFFPIDAVKDEAGNVVGFKPPEVDNRLA